MTMFYVSMKSDDINQPDYKHVCRNFLLLNSESEVVFMWTVSRNRLSSPPVNLSSITFASGLSVKEHKVIFDQDLYFKPQVSRTAFFRLRDVIKIKKILSESEKTNKESLELNQTEQQDRRSGVFKASSKRTIYQLYNFYCENWKRFLSAIFMELL